jgi:ATP-binding cassette subfamily B protein
MSQIQSLQQIRRKFSDPQQPPSSAQIESVEDPLLYQFAMQPQPHQPTPTVTPPTSAWQDYSRVAIFLRPYQPRLVFVVAVSLIATALGLAQPYFSKLLIDRALLKKDWQWLCWVAAFMFGTAILGFLLNILASYQYVRISAAMLFDMRLALFRHLESMSPPFYAKWRLGDLVSRLNNDIGEVQRVSADSLLSVLSNVVFFFGSAGLMWYLSPRLFLLSVVFLPVSLYSFNHYQKRLTAQTRTLRERSADLGSFFVETLIGARLVATSNALEHETERFRERNDGFVTTLLRLQLTSFLMGAMPGSILTASSAAVFLYGGWLIFDDRISIGSLVAFMAYHSRLLAPIQNMMGLSSSLAAARVSLNRIFELLDTPPEVVEKPNALSLGRIERGIRFDNVSLRHDREPVLDDASFEIPAGAFCAILGSSGAGKSTIANLMVRLLDVDSGSVTVDGVDIRDLRIKDLRREVVLIDQDPYLLNATIAENIAYPNPQASRVDIEKAGTEAGLDELIARLPNGYDTQTGERGLALSAGERQRIALARGLLRKPSVLILDEPTSALDLTTEAIVVHHLRETLRGTTIIMITHRPALAEIADQVITVKERKALTLIPS